MSEKETGKDISSLLVFVRYLGERENESELTDTI